MLNDWKVQLANTRKAAATLSGANPKFVQAFQALNAASRIGCRWVSLRAMTGRHPEY
jgi:hypothetical protein